LVTSPANGWPRNESPWSIHDWTVIASHSAAFGARHGASSGTVTHRLSIARIASAASTAPVGVSSGIRPEYVATLPLR
jgi:hypothetical protein